MSNNGTLGLDVVSRRNTLVIETQRVGSMDLRGLIRDALVNENKALGIDEFVRNAPQI